MKIQSFTLSPARFSFPQGPSPISAGFPSPAENYMDAAIDLNKELVKHPSATFFVRVEGDSMLGAGIHHGDTLIVDRSLEAQDRDIIIAVLDGEFTVKRLLLENKQILLQPENEKYEPIQVEESQQFLVWGVVTYVIHPASRF